MELLEEVLRLSRRAEDQAEALRETIRKLADIPVIEQNHCVYKELIRAGYQPEGRGDYGNGTAWSACRRIIEQHREMQRLAGLVRGEAEVPTAIADDLIGQTGRLI